ncbi:DUF3892 domain-containing protein [Bradyrhizobium sp. CCGUVB23]|uniref:DUF3892 domain-containing protein n=1 Tax=Bradyrhizobium sp. CCGUVB23 TaxID=2949630 RepID=UPI0020B4312D|nr:DUF3892 domain-containing protein [Bradyrhizobium sp. CCGUVB23]MCP3460575.1 DUF3892 domain-containing protein [Bradyrhizobium sp. CCGUVB23]
MTKHARIRCINTTDRKNPHERLSHVGGANPDGTPWKRSIDQAIGDIEINEWRVLCRRKRPQG